jgi:alpha-amylase
MKLKQLLGLLMLVVVSAAWAIAPAGAPAGAQSRSTRPRTAPAGWWNNRVFYEIYVRSFQDSDGDGIGDFAGVTKRLDYLKELGVGGLWLMPIFMSDTEHGYATTNYRLVEPDYGSLADFQTLLAEAKQRDIKVLIDFVPNHTSSTHPWFASAQSNPQALTAKWYRFEKKKPAQIGPYGPAWHPTTDGRWYFGLFGSGQPDLNLTNPQVTSALLKDALYWLNMGVDGFRLDAVKHLVERGTQVEGTIETRKWLESFQSQLVKYKPDVMTVAEAWTSTTAVAAYVPKAADTAFDFDLAKAFVKTVRDQSEIDLIVELDTVSKLIANQQYATFLSNHDQTRIATAVGAEDDTARSQQLLKQAASLLLTAPGIPFLYYGEELGMTGAKPDENLRLPMAWDATKAGGFTTGTPFRPIASSSAKRHVAAQRDDPASLLSHYRSLMSLRRSLPALSGSYQKLKTPTTGAVAWIRSDGRQSAVVIHNVTDRPLRVPLSATAGIPRGPVSMAFGLPTTTDVTQPELSPDGSVDGWTPLAEVPARTSVVLRIGS